MSQAVSKRIAVILSVRLVLVATALVFFPTHLFAQAVLTSSLSSIDFGNQQINVESDPITLTLANIGNDPGTGINCAVADRPGGDDPEMFTAATCPASLAAGAFFAVNVTFTPTSVGSKGAQLIVAYHDGSSLTDTSISLDGTGVELSSDAPDLVVISPGVSNPTPVEGETFTISATVQNIGDAASSTTTLDWYLSVDALITTDDLLVDTDSVFILDPGATSPESTQQAIPDAGTYWVGACVQDEGDESNVDNQCSTGVRINVAEQELIFADGFE